MIEDVKEFTAETQRQLLGQMKLALEGNVRLCGSEAAEHVAAEIPLLPLLRRRSERSAVEDSSAGILRTKKLKRHSGHETGSRVQCYAGGKDDSGDHVDRGS